MNSFERPTAESAENGEPGMEEMLGEMAKGNKDIKLGGNPADADAVEKLHAIVVDKIARFYQNNGPETPLPENLERELEVSTKLMAEKVDGDHKES